MALLRKEIGHFQEKKELPLDTRWAGPGAGAGGVSLGRARTVSWPTNPLGAGPRVSSLKALLRVPPGPRVCGVCS